MSVLAEFLDKVIEHLANGTTARERVSYHLAESYTLKENPVPYGSLHLPESDIYGKDYRALPPAEEMVLVAWYENAAQLELAQAEAGFIYVRLGRRQGALHVHHRQGVRRVVMRTEGWGCGTRISQPSGGWLPRFHAEATAGRTSAACQGQGRCGMGGKCRQGRRGIHLCAVPHNPGARRQPARSGVAANSWHRSSDSQSD